MIQHVQQTIKYRAEVNGKKTVGQVLFQHEPESGEILEVLLIGTGGVGTVIARHLAKSDKVDKVILADIDLKQAERVSRKVGKRKTQAIRFDAGNKSQVDRLMKRKAMVVNSSLPRFNSLLMESALKHKVKYVDLALEDPVKPYRLNAAWKKKGAAAVIGVGEDPGISNVAAKYAADSMDAVKSIKIRDGETANSRKYPFVCLFSPATFIQETMEEPAIFRDGKLQKIANLSDKEIYNFPEGIGELPIYSVNHEEVYSLPKNIGKGVQYVDFKLALTDDTLKYLDVLNGIGLMSDKKLKVGKTEISPRDLTLKLIPQPAELGSDITGKAMLLVEVEGTKGGRDVKHTIYCHLDHGESYRKYGVTGTSFLTGTGAAAGALQLLENEKAAGVYAPEQLDAARYFEILEGLGVKPVHIEE